MQTIVNKTQILNQVVAKNISLQENVDLLAMYMNGFRDELWNRPLQQDFASPKHKVAYHLGKQHAIIGDEVSSIDSLSKNEILALIEKKC